MASFRHESLVLPAAVDALGDRPAVSRHVQQEDIDGGLVGFEELFEHGRALFVANVFVLAQALDPVTQSIEPEFSNERSTLGMQGSGAIEMLAREKSAELQARRDAGLERARRSGGAVRVRQRAKRVAFGALVAYPDGAIDGSHIEGVDADLVIRPFHQNGVRDELSVGDITAHWGKWWCFCRSAAWPAMWQLL